VRAAAAPRQPAAAGEGEIQRGRTRRPPFDQPRRCRGGEGATARIGHL